MNLKLVNHTQCPQCPCPYGHPDSFFPSRFFLHLGPISAKILFSNQFQTYILCNAFLFEIAWRAGPSALEVYVEKYDPLLGP